MKFVADDGQVFNTMEECEEYEKIQGDGRYVAMMWYMSITMYDTDGEEVQSAFRWDKDTKDYLDDTHDICCHKAYFIKIDCSADVWEKIKNYFENEYGTYLPNYETDIFRYNTIDDEWVSFREEYATFKKRWKSVGVRF